MNGLSEFADVAVPVAVRGTFIYSIPPHLRDDVRLGSRVEVPLGTKRTTGFVVNLLDAVASTAKLKPIHSVLDEDEPALLPEIIDLCRWAAEYYIAPLGEMLRVALPANMAARGRRELVLSGAPMPNEPLIEELKKRPLLLKEALEAFSRSTIQRLRDDGIISIRDRLRDAVGVRFDRFAVLIDDSDGPPKQRAAIEFLRSRGGESLLSALPVGPSTINTLARKGMIRIERRPRRHTLDAFLAGLDPASVREIRYSAEQQHAIDAIKATLGTFAPFLLEGVTGSGKTEVYVEVMREAVRRGQQALLLVPEISLTPVFAARLKERFGERIAILHSSLSPSERYDQWWRARRGEVDVAIGPRSALFTPFHQLGVIVVDEEGDGAYKQDETPRYNARDLAVVRAQLRNIPVVLGSATPS
ncbi:MAG TPA: DEAD/DEAH box helicase, partial [Thermoanaerobaculia bacterium]